MDAPGWVSVELVWRVGAGAVWVVAAGLLVWALVAGRSRGRARCPGGWVVWPRVRVGGRAVGVPWRQGCWYDVSGTVADGDGAVRCPECGRRQSARALGRTRRRWRWACAACALALGGGALWVAPGVQERGWVKSVPTFVLVEIASVDEWLADVGLREPWAPGGAVVAEMQGRLNDGNLAAAQRWAQRVERRLERAGKLDVDAASVEALGHLQGTSVTAEFWGTPAAEVFAAIEAAAGVPVQADWAGMELSPQTPVSIGFDGRRCDLALRDAAWALPRESGALSALGGGVVRVEQWRTRRERFAVVDVEGLARWLRDIGAEGRGSAGSCVEDDYFDGDLAQTVYRPTLWEGVRYIEDIITEMVHPLMWARNGGEGAQLEAVGTTLVIAGSAEVVHETVRLVEMLDAARVTGERQVVEILPAGGLDSGRQWEPERGEPLVCLPVGGYLGLCERAEAYRAATAAARAERAAEAKQWKDDASFVYVPALVQEVNLLIDLIGDLIEPEQWEWNGGTRTILSAGTLPVIDAPPYVHDRIGALLEAMRRAQATHQAVEAPGVVPGQRVRVVPLCGLLLETADRAPLPGIPEAVERELLEYMVERLEPGRSAWSLQFVSRMAVICGDDSAQAVFDAAVEALRGGATAP